MEDDNHEFSVKRFIIATIAAVLTAVLLNYLWK